MQRQKILILNIYSAKTNTPLGLLKVQASWITQDLEPNIAEPNTPKTPQGLIIK